MKKYMLFDGNFDFDKFFEAVNSMKEDHSIFAHIVKVYTHWVRATKEFSPNEYCIEDVLRAIGRDFRSCLHA